MIDPASPATTQSSVHRFRKDEKRQIDKSLDQAMIWPTAHSVVQGGHCHQKEEASNTSPFCLNLCPLTPLHRGSELASTRSWGCSGQRSNPTECWKCRYRCRRRLHFSKLFKASRNVDAGGVNLVWYCFRFMHWSERQASRSKYYTYGIQD